VPRLHDLAGRPGAVPGRRPDRGVGDAPRAAVASRLRGDGPGVRTGSGMSALEPDELRDGQDRPKERWPTEPPYEETVPPGGYEGQVPTEAGTPPHVPPPAPIQGAWRVLRRGVAESPELRAGFGYTLALAMALAAGRVVIPVLIQQVIDHGIDAQGGF